MTEMLLSQGLKPEITFANTGWEHHKTLEFVENCHKRWMDMYGVGVTLLEAVVNGENTASTHKVVTFDNLSTNCEPFLEVVKKYGVPNIAYLHCTRELKENPIISYMKSIGGVCGHIKDKNPVPANYETFLGIRADEQARLKGNRNGKQIKVYPLADWAPLRVDKLDVLDWWEGMPFDLGIEEHEGNCLGCYKKSQSKILKLIQSMGEGALSFASHIENNYGNVGDNIINGVKSKTPRTMYRNYMTADKLIAISKTTDISPKVQDAELTGCESDCLPFMTGNEMEEKKESQADMFT